MSTRVQRRPWGDEAAELFSPEQRRLLGKVRRGQITGEELVAYFDSDNLEVSGTIHYTKFTPSPLKLFVPNQLGRLAGGLVGIPTPADPQSDPAGYSSNAQPWVTGITFPLEPDEPDASTVLIRLRGGSDAESREAVFDSETVDFSAEQSAELVSLLRQYIDRHRRVAERDAMVVTAAAIRGYLAHLPATGLEAVADLFERNDMPTALENETVKMVVRKLTAVPPTQNDQYPRLAEQVALLATSYVAPRLVNREYYGATALNSVLAMALLRTSRWADTLSRVSALPDRGFRLQAGRRAAAVATAPRAVPLPDPVRAALEALAGVAADTPVR